MKKPGIFIVEDEIITRHHLQRVLERIGYEVTGVAGSGVSALKQLEQSRPDLLLADISLEGEICGIEVAARARDAYGIPTVFLTAYSDAETIRRARSSEPYGFLVKPFDEQELQATIEIGLQQNAFRTAQAQELAANAEALSRNREELKNLASQLLRAQETERTEIARDLHDDFGQRLALIQISIETFWQQLPAESREAGEAEYQGILRLLIDFSRDLRNVSHRLHPSILDDLGLEVAIRELVEAFEERYCMPTRFSVRNLSQNIPREIALSFYRIVQEALHNIGKHAGPEALVTIALLGGGERVDLTIRDTGRGFDSHALPPNGIGLISMVQRAEAVGGRVVIESVPGQGTRIHVCIPLSQARDSCVEQPPLPSAT